VKVKKPLADLVTADPQIEPVERWKQLHLLTGRIEASGAKQKSASNKGFASEEDEKFRIRACRQGQLRKELEQENKTVKWGKYLRAPDVYFDILKEGRFCLLRDFAAPKFGSKTRINEFFHVNSEVAEQFGIEDEYLMPLIKSPKDSTRIPIALDELDLKIFVCRRSKTELKKLGHHGALNYIEWGENQTYKRGEFRGLPWPDGTWVAKRQPAWYALPNTETNLARLFFAQAFGDRHMHRYCPDDIIPDARLYFLNSSSTITEEIVAACLNSSTCALCCEIAGRVTMGDGVLELKVEDARDYLFVPDLRKISAVSRKAILKAFDVLCQREIGSVFEEVTKKDRQALDEAILAAIGLDPKKYLRPIYDGLCELVRERIELGAQRSKIRKTRARKTNAEKQVFQNVLDEILPDGTKRFPDDFLSASISKKDLTEIQLPEQALKLDARPITMCLYTDEGVFREVKNPAEGKFIVYCQQGGQKTASVPVKMVEITRTVANYESYLRDLRKTLYDAFYRHTLDVGVAAKLTQTAFERFRLPSMDSA
jgi:hypothetical protein